MKYSTRTFDLTSVMPTPSNAPNASRPPPFMRRASPFMKKKRPLPKPGATPLRRLQQAPHPGALPGGQPGIGQEVKPEPQEPSLNQYKQFSISTCTPEELENVRYHLMKLQSKKEVNPARDFVRPVRLHRKDPRNMQFQLTLKELDEQEKLGVEKPPDAEAEAAAEDRFRKRNKRKTLQVRQNEKADRLRYEEYYPWVIEDYEGANTYVGAYEAASSLGNNHALLVPTSDGGFKLIPLDKIYRFTPRNKYATYTLEEAEERMNKWNLLGFKHKKDEPVALGGRRSRLKTVSTDDALFDEDGKRMSDDEGMDYDEEFADDDGAPIVGDDEAEEKESKKKMDREMLAANTGLEETNDDVDDGLFEEKKKFDKEGKKLKKVLEQNEYGQIMYDSDDEENPYLSESDLEPESDHEVKREEEEENVPKASTPTHHTPQIRVKLPVNNPIGVVTVVATKAILSQFPQGEWAPKKRVIAAQGGKPKKQKIEGGSAAPLTEEEVVELVRNNELTFKELCIRLKSKLSKNDTNTEIFKQVVRRRVKSRTRPDGVKVLIVKE